MMRRSSLGRRRRASCALDRADALICSTVCRSMRGAQNTAADKLDDWSVEDPVAGSSNSLLANQS